MLLKRTKITRRAFESKIADHYKISDVVRCPYEEMEIDCNGIVKMSLYYINFNKRDQKHIGTWCKGEGWLF